MITRTWKTLLVELLLIGLLILSATPVWAQDPHVVIRVHGAFPQADIQHWAQAVGADPWPLWSIRYASGYRVYAFGPAVPQPQPVAAIRTQTTVYRTRGFVPNWRAYSGEALRQYLRQAAAAAAAAGDALAQAAPMLFGLVTQTDALNRAVWGQAAVGPTPN